MKKSGGIQKKLVTVGSWRLEGWGSKWILGGWATVGGGRFYIEYVYTHIRV